MVPLATNQGDPDDSRRLTDPPSRSPRCGPPGRQSTLVRSDVRHTFDTFVRTIGVWWPVSPFSAGQDRVRDVTIDQHPGGRVYETWDDGTEVDWGELLAWEPPARFVMTWAMTPVPTEVELSFAALWPRAHPGHGGAPGLGSAVRSRNWRRTARCRAATPAAGTRPWHPHSGALRGLAHPGRPGHPRPPGERLDEALTAMPSRWRPTSACCCGTPGRAGSSARSAPSGSSVSTWRTCCTW